MPSDSRPTTSKAALARLRAGNRRFVSGKGQADRAFRSDLAEGQAPFAVILGCSDSRAPAEYVFDQGLGDLFVIRVAGNIVAPSLVGSVEFATGKFGCPIVVVMGHTHCGAIGATVDALKHGGRVDSPNLRSIVRRIRPHIAHLFTRPDAHDDLVHAAVAENARASTRELLAASPLLLNQAATGKVQIVASVFDLATGVVTFLD